MNAARGRIGRPPGPHDDTLARLLPAAERLLVDEGAAALTPTRLHAETGVSRATVYRNWPDPADLIEIMLARATDPPPEDGFVGHTPTDLHQAGQWLLRQVQDRPFRAFVGVCLEYGRTSERLAAAAEVFLAAILAPFRRVLAAAVDGGELAGDVDQLVSEVAGPLMLDHVIRGRDLTPERVQTAIDHFLDHHLVAAR
ncbi:MAG: TetR/AcrR family transcriptional regulator [Actinomycetota bacterium]